MRREVVDGHRLTVEIFVDLSVHQHIRIRAGTVSSIIVHPMRPTTVCFDYVFPGYLNR